MADQMTARQVLEDGDRWTDNITRYAMPIVLWCAQNGVKITYGDLEAEMIKRHSRRNVPEQQVKTKYGHPAGKIGDIIFKVAEELDESIPPINAIIVRRDTNLPAEGVEYYLKRFLRQAKRGRLSKDDRNALAEETIQAVFNYPKWDLVARHLGLDNLERVDHKDDQDPIQLPKPTGVWGGGGESKEHRELKETLAANPRFFSEYGQFGEGDTEFWLRSGDEVDVLFKNDSTILAVEVKTGNAPDDELARGIFQCIKYRAVLRAMQTAVGAVPNAKSVIISTRPLTGEIRRLAQRLQVPSMQWKS